MSELSIIFVNWNSADYLRACLQSIYLQTQGVDFEVIVVDNASPKDGVDQLKQEFPQIQLIKSKENLGFARANNAGFKQSSGKYILFLNPDTEVLGRAIPKMLERLRSLPGAGVVGCKLLNSDASVQTSCIQRFPTILNQMLDIEALRLRWPAHRLWRIDALFSLGEEPREVDVISGACLMIQREVFEAAGLFSEDYFMYAEDADLCFKVHRKGFKNYFVGGASVVHHGGGSSKQNSNDQWSAIVQREAVLQLCRKTRGPLYASMFRAATAAAALVRLIAVFPVLVIGQATAPKQRVISTSKKWMAILRWSMGLEAATLRSLDRRS
jgi:N-acetylglucosaminyl-diphospho-decaprenol L-rhamnosyltransferase